LGKEIVFKSEKGIGNSLNKKSIEYFFDIKTAKPNKDGFKEFKRTLLEWVRCALAENPKADISTLIAIPYNMPPSPKMRKQKDMRHCKSKKQTVSTSTNKQMRLRYRSGLRQMAE
jgi:hypothetical protein